MNAPTTVAAFTQQFTNKDIRSFDKTGKHYATAPYERIEEFYRRFDPRHPASYKHVDEVIPLLTGFLPVLKPAAKLINKDVAVPRFYDELQDMSRPELFDRKRLTESNIKSLEKHLLADITKRARAVERVLGGRRQTLEAIRPAIEQTKIDADLRATGATLWSDPDLAVSNLTPDPREPYDQDMWIFIADPEEAQNQPTSLADIKEFYAYLSLEHLRRKAIENVIDSLPDLTKPRGRPSSEGPSAKRQRID